MTRWLTVHGVVGVALITVAVGCGSQPGPRLGSDDVAVVGTVHISKSTYTNLLARARRTTEHSYSRIPEPTSALSNAVMARLVTEAEKQDAATTQHTTVAALRGQIEARVRVGADVRATFSGFFGDRPHRAREVRTILLYDRPVAQRLFAQLSVGSDASWCALALKSIEHGPGYRCGTALVANGDLVKPLGRLVFSIRQGVPTLVHTKPDGYWTILEAISPIYTGGSPQQVTRLLLLQSKTVRRGRWEARLARRYCTGENVSYRHGYKPDPDPTVCRH